MNENIYEIITSAIRERIFEKAVFAKPCDKNVKKSVGTLFEKDGEIFFRLETFTADGKALHRVISSAEAPSFCADLLGEYRAADIITSRGVCNILVSKGGEAHISNHISRSGGQTAEIGAHDREKRRFIPEDADFLVPLGVSGKNGRVLDRARSKYRQIDRFVGIVDSIYDELPSSGVLEVCDLCCGKSYLSFAVYWYLTNVRRREVRMSCVDLKADVIALCGGVASSLGYGGMSFICGDINSFSPPAPPCLTLSLHACDIATDIVLAFAARHRSKVILSTPCCHHEIFHQMKPLSGGLAPLSDHSMLKQKLSDALTDSLRAKLLEASGYSVAAVELIDPEETPKNILLRAVANKRPDKVKMNAAAEDFKACCSLFGVEPTLGKLLGII